jgi:hypothetical protein
VIKPNILQIVGTVLRLPRLKYSRDFALFVTSAPNTKLHESYKAGLVLLAYMIGGILLLWAFILIWLKLQGKSVGCAAGFAFVQNSKRDKNEAQDVSETSEYAGDQTWEERQLPETESLPNPREMDEDANCSFEIGLSQVNVNEHSLDETVAPTQRERRTQVCFFFFGLVTLVCVPLILVVAFKPLVNASAESKVYIHDSRDVIDETTAAMVTISLASEGSLNVAKNMTMDIGVICPNFSSAEVEAALGVDLASMVELLNTNYTNLAHQVSGNLSDVNEVLQYYEEVLSIVETSFNEADKYLWLVPTMLFTLSLTTALIMVGVCCSWKRQSSRRFQRCTSYGILPVLIVLCLSCWFIATGSAIATAVGGDACMSGSSSGSPDETISAVLRAKNMDDSTSPLYKYISAYTTGCHKVDPVEFISSIESEVQTTVDFIWNSLSKVDAVGQVNLEQYCGGEKGVLGNFLVGSQDLAEFLASIQKALDSASTSLSCQRINAIYVQAVNESICTEVTSGYAWGFIFFLCVGISTMAMITLRASWRHKIGEENIYDEGEVAENMIVDEHEEYLVYISKYKHEWDEYQGLGATLSNPHIYGGSTDSLEHSSSAESEGVNSLPQTGTLSVVEGPSVMSVVFLEEQSIEVVKGDEEAFDPYNTADTQSQASTISGGNISFVSLNDVQSFGNEQSPAGPALFVLPPPLLQRYVDQEHDDKGDILPHDQKGSREFSVQDNERETNAMSLSPSKSLRTKQDRERRTPNGTFHMNMLSCRKTVDVDNLKKALDEIGASNLAGPLGIPVSLSAPPKRARPSPINSSPGSVQFQVMDG